jgi:hypothetical protein
MSGPQEIEPATHAAACPVFQTSVADPQRQVSLVQQNRK